MSASAVRAFLQRNGLQANRELGQNFLCDESLAKALVEKAGVEPGDHVLEIGTGQGILTRALAARAAQVVTLEVDSGLVRALRAEAALPANVTLLHADVLQVDLQELVGAREAPVRLVGNLPYSISGPLLRRLLDLRDVLLDWSVMVQHEVAERLLAAPGSRDYGSLAVLHALTVEVARVRNVAPGCFHPRPQVRSTFLRIRPLATPALELAELPWVERVVRAAFSQRRKTLVNALQGGALDPAPDSGLLLAELELLGVDARARAETVPPESLLALARRLAQEGVWTTAKS